MKRFGILVLAVTMLVLAVTPTFAKGPPGFGFLYYDGDVVRTVVPPAAMPKPGTDPLYPIMGGAEGQLPVAGVAPGDRDYRGGKWAVNVVTWNVDPYLLTSEAEVMKAASSQLGRYSVWVGKTQPGDTAEEVLPVAIDKLGRQLGFSSAAHPGGRNHLFACLVKKWDEPIFRPAPLLVVTNAA